MAQQEQYYLTLSSKAAAVALEETLSADAAIDRYYEKVDQGHHVTINQVGGGEITVEQLRQVAGR